MKAGYVEFHNKKQMFIASDFGVPQGGIISPLLSNIILHELDVYMENRRLGLLAQTAGILPKYPNKAYTRLSSKIQ